MKNIGILGLLLLGMAIVLMRWHTACEPFHGDITFYAVVGHEMQFGKKLYSDLIDHKPPAIYLSYAWAEKIAGYGSRSIFLLNCFCALLSLLGIFLAAKRLGNGTSAGLLAALVWSITCGDLLLEANQPNVEVFVNVALVWAFALWIAPKEHARSWARDSVIGLLLTLSTLYWQPAVVVAMSLCLTLLILEGPPMESRRAVLRRILILFVIGVVSWAALGLYFYGTNRFLPFYQLLFEFQTFYANQTLSLWGRLLQSFHPFILPTPLAQGALRHFLPLLWFPLLGLLLSFRSRKEKNHPWLYWMAYGIGVHGTILLPNKFFSHSYQLWLPVLAVGWGGALGELMALDFPQAKKYAAAGVGIGLLFLLVMQGPDYRLSAEESSIRKYGYEYAITRHMGQDLKTILHPDERFYNWGLHTGLYFWARQRPLSRSFYCYFLIAGPQAVAWTYRDLRELQQHRPELFIVSPWIGAGKEIYFSNPIYLWGLANYRPFLWEGHQGSFIFLTRRGGNLEKRILRGELPCRF